MKKKLVILLAMSLAVTSLAACGKSSSSSEVESSSQTEETSSSDETTVYNDDGTIAETTDESLLPDVTIEETAFDGAVDKLADIESSLSSVEWFNTYNAEAYMKSSDTTEESISGNEFYTVATYWYTWAPSSVPDDAYVDGTATFEDLYFTDYVELSWSTLSGKLRSMSLELSYSGHSDEYIAIADAADEGVLAVLFGEDIASQLKSMFYNQSETFEYESSTVTVTKTGETNESDKTVTYEISVVYSDGVETTSESGLVDIADVSLGYASTMDELQANITEDFMLNDIELLMLTSEKFEEEYSLFDGYNYSYIEYMISDDYSSDITFWNNEEITMVLPIADGYDFDSVYAVVLSNLAARLTGTEQAISESSATVGGYTLTASEYTDGYITVQVVIE